MQVPTDPEGDFVADNGYPQRVSQALAGGFGWQFCARSIDVVGL